jgi:hypothetical protein
LLSLSEDLLFDVIKMMRASPELAIEGLAFLGVIIAEKGSTEFGSGGFSFN